MVLVMRPAIFLFLCLTSTVFLLKHANSQDLNSTEESIYINCSSGRPFDQGSIYETNLYYLYNNLTSNSDTKKFFNYSVGEDPNRVYGLFHCYKGIDNRLCQDCIRRAEESIKQNCPSSVEAIAMNIICVLRYANRPISSINDVSKYNRLVEGPKKYGKYKQQLSSTFISLFDEATSGNSSSSALTFSYFTESVSVFAQVDCIPVLSSSDCRSCLQTALRRIGLDGHDVGMLEQPSCRLMYIFIADGEEPPSLEPAPPESEPAPPKSSVSPNKKLYGAISAISVIAAISLSLIFLLIRCLRRRKPTSKPNGLEELESMESLHIEFDAIKVATHNFSDANKLGQGGFGIVYKGILADGQAVAVKRLSNASGQGIREFKTEACLAAKLQHRNLVKVYGFCVEAHEMLLVYEFVPNKSLDQFLFDANRGVYLKWETRYKILVGIARGLVYLHEDSCPKIIHRDLKPSNILLDEEMNPKIADFGMAKLFGGDQTQGNTSRIAGTFGYMAPEYIATGHFSFKSDIFSFGVILLEIVSGLRCLDPTSQEEGLLSYAWKLWNEADLLNLVDSTLGNDFSKDDIERCVHVGLLCTQEDPAKRPNMASVLIMLNTQLKLELPLPASPPNFPYKQESTAVSHGSCSGIVVEDIITELCPR